MLLLSGSVLPGPRTPRVTLREVTAVPWFTGDTETLGCLNPTAGPRIRGPRLRGSTNPLGV